MPPPVNPPPEEHLLDIIENGLPRASNPSRIVIMGAGMAGLVAAHELQRAGHVPVVLEARGRVGGRVETLRAPFSDGLYAEAGAMRIPRGHRLTMAYVKNFNLECLPFTVGNPNAYIFLEGRRFRVGEVQADPNCLGFAVNPHERNLTVRQLWDHTIAPIRAQIARGNEAAWSDINRKYQEHSIRSFLLESKWSESAIHLFGLLEGYEARMSASFLDILRAEISHSFTEVVRIDGGADRLPRAFEPALRPNLRYGAEVFQFSQGESSVTVRYRTKAGESEETGNYAICTLPFPVLRHIEGREYFSREKRHAIQSLHYDRSCKIFLQCKRRFWEEDDKIYGGGSITDRAIRNCYYPDHGKGTGRGVLLASYTWADDSDTWASLENDDRIKQAIEDVHELHPQIRREFEIGASKCWQQDCFAGGAFALFEPGQQALLHPHIATPEGRIHFAGEHVSQNHRWIQGAIESGLVAAEAIVERASNDRSSKSE